MDFEDDLRLKRITDLINSIGSRSLAVALTGVTRETLRNYTLGETEPKFSVIAKLCDSQKVSLDYIWHGDQVPDFIKRKYLKSNDEFVFIDKLDVVAQAGSGRVVNHEKATKIGYRKEFFKRLNRDYQTTKQVSVANDSMRDSINSGDEILVDVSVTSFVGEGIYTILADNLLIVKRLQKIGKDKLLVMSDNKKSYADFEISVSETGEGGNYQIKGQAYWRIQPGNRL